MPLARHVLTEGMKLQQAAGFVPDCLPDGLLRLQDLARALTGNALSVERNLRVVVTVPTLRLASAVAALGATQAHVDCTDCAHRQLEVGARVTGWASGVFTDAGLTAITTNDLTFAGIRLVGHRETIHRLPDGFPPRRNTKLPDSMRAELAAAYGCSEAVAGQRLSAACAHPVVVAGEPSAYRADVELLAGAGAGLRARLTAGGRLQDWFRHPVLAIGSLPEPEDEPWVSELRPRLVVVAGSAGWVSSSRRLWPDVPVLVMLSRRSPAAVEVATTIAASGWRSPQAMPSPLAGALQPGAGLEITCVVEPDAAPVGEDLW